MSVASFVIDPGTLDRFRAMIGTASISQVVADAVGQLVEGKSASLPKILAGVKKVPRKVGRPLNRSDSVPRKRRGRIRAPAKSK